MAPEIKLSCLYCGPERVLFQAVHDPRTASEAEWRAYWRNRQVDRGQGRPDDHTDITCPDCGAQFDMLGDPDPDGHVVRTNVSRPRVVSLTPGSGRAGTRVTLRGQALDVGSLVVSFGERPATIGARSATEVQVEVPAGAGQVDVTVENELGRREEGSVLAGGFTYA